MYAQATIKPNTLLRNGAYGIVMRGVQKCTRGCSSLRCRKRQPLCCIKLDTATDPCMGSGYLMLSCKHYSNEPDYIKYYGQELMPSTYNLARMNMFLHRVHLENQHLRNGDTLDADWPTDEDTAFDAVTMNPPYSAKWSAAEGFKRDERFMDYGGKLAPKSKADYAFLLHGFYHLKQTGTMAIVLPHGVLFRGAAEGTIRETLLRNGSIYAVIGLLGLVEIGSSVSWGR